MQILVLTVIGADRPGIIERLSKVIYTHKGDWLRSSFSHIAGRFAGMLEVAIPAENEKAVRHDLGLISGLNIVVSQGETDDDVDYQSVQLWLTGNDKQGIVQEVSQALNKLNVNVLQLDTECESAPNWGGALFKAEAELEVPIDLEISVVKDALEAIANDLVVDIELSKRL